jgi:hypothetical protein
MFKMLTKLSIQVFSVTRRFENDGAIRGRWNAFMEAKYKKVYKEFIPEYAFGAERRLMDGSPFKLFDAEGYLVGGYRAVREDALGDSIQISTCASGRFRNQAGLCGQHQESISRGASFMFREQKDPGLVKLWREGLRKEPEADCFPFAYLAVEDADGAMRLGGGRYKPLRKIELRGGSELHLSHGFLADICGKDVFVVGFNLDRVFDSEKATT